MSSPKFSIIIVTWNGLEHLKTFLPSVTRYTPENCEILIADNHSTDGTGDWIAANHPRCRHIYLDNNYGYCGGNNRAAAQAKGDILLFLNNDVEVTPDWLTPIQHRFEAKPNTVAIQPKLRDYTHPTRFEYAGAAGGLLDYYGYPFCRGRIFDSVETDEGQYDEPSLIHWVSGAALAVRRTVFEELGGFDEHFRFHMEEIDLCWRIRNRGHDVEYVPESTVYHLGGGSLSSGSYRKWFYNYRNNLFMLLKNLPKRKTLSRILMRQLLDGIAGFYALIRLKPNETTAILHAHLSFYRHIPSIRKSRKSERAKISTYQPANLKSYSVVWQYFIRGIKKYQDLPEHGSA